MCVRIFYFIFTIDAHTKYHNLRMRRLRRKKKSVRLTTIVRRLDTPTTYIGTR